jgi:hypothetical protein
MEMIGKLREHTAHGNIRFIDPDRFAHRVGIAEITLGQF